MAAAAGRMTSKQTMIWGGWTVATFRALLRCSAIVAVQAAWPGTVSAQVAAAPAPGSASPADQATAGIDDIIVTAQRREESLQRVPLAITAIGTAALREQNVQTLADVARIAPNIAISSSATPRRPTPCR